VRLELTRLAPPPPQDGVSTNSTTSATISASAGTTASARIHGSPGELHNGLTETSTTPIPARGARRVKKILLEFARDPHCSHPLVESHAGLWTELSLRGQRVEPADKTPGARAKHERGLRTQSTWERLRAWPALARCSPRARPSVRLCPRLLRHPCPDRLASAEPRRLPAQHPMHPNVDRAGARP
jgi:hypothetical protein